MLAGLLPRAAAAAQLEFLPIRVLVGLGPVATTIQVINHGGGTSNLQVRSFAWEQGGDGADNYTRSDEIVVSPPMFSLPEKETQLLRIVLRTKPGPREQAFRIILDELPPPGAQNLQFALRVSLPVFATPQGATADLRWSVSRGEGGLVVEARNSGAMHARISKLTLASPGRAPVEGKLKNRLPYILAGSSRSWTVPLQSQPGSEVRLLAELDGTQLSQNLQVGS